MLLSLFIPVYIAVIDLKFILFRSVFVDFSLPISLSLSLSRSLWRIVLKLPHLA